ncbi:hypothetical protein [Prochlorococcus marinus]|uniref:hypothetical protein n=1 Tax=Prochlorococcus marinus TaxID=1219 RepID=UPI001AD9A1FD|nr:hypothetical protein [Prochlorococcus marinus]MBO8205112.1 hypothetical protein [Prochlorococcus marinus CUG1415]MBW3044380.1 hypothetical protein [Prochlorococcus marinus str. MU1415]
MIKNHLDNEVNKKDELLKLTVRILRQEAKKLSIPLYSRKNKALLANLILKYQKKSLIEDQTNNDRELLVDKNFKVSAEVSTNIISDEDSNLKSLVSKSFPDSKLKSLLSKSFPDKKITVTDNKDGSQTILIN